MPKNTELVKKGLGPLLNGLSLFPLVLAMQLLVLNTSYSMPEDFEEEEPHSETKPNLVLDPPPTLEGIAGEKVEVNVKLIDIGPEGYKLEKFVGAGSDETKVYLLELSSTTPYWLDYMSSMGADSRDMLMQWVHGTLLSEYAKKEKINEIVTEPSMLQSMLGGASTSGLKRGAEILANYIGKLMHPYEDRYPIDRPINLVSLKICPFSQRLFTFILVDPEPMSGPDNKSYLIIIENVYSE